MHFEEYLKTFAGLEGVALYRTTYLRDGERQLVKPVTQEDREQYAVELAEASGRYMDSGLPQDEADRLALDDLGCVEVWEYARRSQADMITVREVPEFYGDTRPLLLTADERRERRATERRMDYAQLAYHRLMSLRDAAIGNCLGASRHREQAALFASALRPKKSEPRRVHYPEIREEIGAWVRQAEMEEAEAHLTADDYLYA